MFVFLRSSLRCNLILKVLVFGDGAFGFHPHEWEQYPYKGDPRELPHAFTTQGHSDKTVSCELGRRPSSDPDSAGALILAFPASRTVRNTFLLCISPPVHGTLLWQLEWTETTKHQKVNYVFKISKKYIH